MRTGGGEILLARSNHLVIWFSSIIPHSSSTLTTCNRVTKHYFNMSSHYFKQKIKDFLILMTVHLWLQHQKCSFLMYITCGINSTLWHLLTGIAITQRDVKMPNATWRWWHLMAFLMKLSLKFWSSAAPINNIIPAPKGYIFFSGVMPYIYFNMISCC